jgi:hypothetical protein
MFSGHFPDLSVGNPGKGGLARRVRFLVDTGAFLSVVPGSALRGLEVDPRTRRLKRTKMYLMPVLFGRN